MPISKFVAGWNEYAEDFQDSTGWFKRSKKRFALHNVRVTEEIGSVDRDGAQKIKCPKYC